MFFWDFIFAFIHLLSLFDFVFYQLDETATSHVLEGVALCGNILCVDCVCQATGRLVGASVGTGHRVQPFIPSADSHTHLDHVIQFDVSKELGAIWTN